MSVRTARYFMSVRTARYFSSHSYPIAVAFTRQKAGRVVWCRNSAYHTDRILALDAIIVTRFGQAYNGNNNEPWDWIQ